LKTPFPRDGEFVSNVASTDALTPGSATSPTLAAKVDSLDPVRSRGDSFAVLEQRIAARKSC